MGDDGAGGEYRARCPRAPEEEEECPPRATRAELEAAGGGGLLLLDQSPRALGRRLADCGLPGDAATRLRLLRLLCTAGDRGAAVARGPRLRRRPAPGYRCFKAVMFLTGFIFGSIIVYLICLQEKLLPAYGNAGVALGAGVLFGLITMLVQYVGLFMTGFHTGLFLAVISLGVAETFCWQPSSVWATAGVLLGGGLLFAILNLYWQKGLTVIGTSVYGGAIMAGALDYFVEKFLMVKWVWDRVALRDSGPPCWFSWLILSVWPFMILVGMATQWAVTGRGIYHQELVPSKKSRTVNLQRVRTREQRAELRQKKYRYLYQVRTAHGDVISQSYVQALQRKVCGPGETNTLQSDSTHLTILPADQTQLAALTESEDESREISGDIIQLDRRQGSSRESVDFNLGRPPYR